MRELVCPRHMCKVPLGKCMEWDIDEVTGERIQCNEKPVMSTTLYWCKQCNVPIYEERCPLCGEKGKYIATDIRPVFPEEKILLAILLEKDDPLCFEELSVWNNTNFYFIDGEKIQVSIKDFNGKTLDEIQKIKKKYDEYSAQIDYSKFDKIVSRFIQANENRYNEVTDEAISFVKRNMKNKTIINPETGVREDRTDYPITAVREAIVNALVHRDYSIHTGGMPIQIIMYEDRMEIKNPGGIYGRIKVDQLGKMQPDTRNPVLALTLETLRITENRYSGIPTIRREMEKFHLREPEFADERGSFTVTFYKAGNISKEEPEPEEANNLLVFCRTPRTRKEICEYLGLSSVTYAIQTHVMPLVAIGKIKMTNPEKPKSPKQLFYSE